MKNNQNPPESLPEPLIDETLWNKPLPIFVKWMDFLNWLLLTTEKFPKKARFTLSDRLNNLALDVVEGLIEARYNQAKVPHLRAANLKLEKIRILLRLSYEQRYLSHQAYKHASYAINEIGKMLGGWMKQQQGKS
jgi:hypothetical protein